MDSILGIFFSLMETHFCVSVMSVKSWKVRVPSLSVHLVPRCPVPGELHESDSGLVNPGGAAVGAMPGNQRWGTPQTSPQRTIVTQRHVQGPALPAAELRDH